MRRISGHRRRTTPFNREDPPCQTHSARRRGEDALAVLQSHGRPVSVEVGDSVPLLAAGGALSRFDANEIVVCTLPENRSHWLEHDLVNRVRRPFDIPVRHVIAAEEVALAV
jgi:hypothetical protein